MVLNVLRNHKAYWGRGEEGKGVWRWGKREVIYLSLHCHNQNDFCIKMGSDGSHFNVSVGSNVYVCGGWWWWGGGGGGGVRRNNVFTLLKWQFIYLFIFLLHYTYGLILLPFSSTVSLSVRVFSCDWN